MNVYIATAFEGKYPVGTCALVVAHDRVHAIDLLSRELELAALPQSEPLDPDDLTEVDPYMPGATVILDGDY